MYRLVISISSIECRTRNFHYRLNPPSSRSQSSRNCLLALLHGGCYCANQHCSLLHFLRMPHVQLVHLYFPCSFHTAFGVGVTPGPCFYYRFRDFYTSLLCCDAFGAGILPEPCSTSATDANPLILELFYQLDAEVIPAILVGG